MTAEYRRADIPGDLQELIDGYCAGTLTPEQVDRLETCLLDDPELQAYFVSVSYLAMHSALHWRMRDLSCVDPVFAPHQAGTGCEQGGIPAMRSSRASPQDNRNANAGVFSVAVAALLLLVAVAVAAVTAWRFSDRSEPVVEQGVPIAHDDAHARDADAHAGDASVTSPPAAEPNILGRIERLGSPVIVERGGMKLRATVGMPLLPNDFLDVPPGGAAELALSGRSFARLGPRTTFGFDSAEEAVLQEGFVEIDARRNAVGSMLAIETPGARTQVQGAWLSLGASRTRTQIRVAEGRVTASRRTDGTAVEIAEGYCSTISATVDPGPQRSRDGIALFVVSDDKLHPDANWKRFNRAVADRIIGDRLWRSALRVRTRSYAELQADDIEGCAIIVLSLFPYDVGAEQKLQEIGIPDLPVPVVCLEPAGFPVLGMSGPVLNEDYGFGAPTLVDVANPMHALAAGFTGDALELTAISGWARPAPSAMKIMHLHQDPARWTLFAYEQGAPMARGIAPARRVGLFLYPKRDDFDLPALDLVDAAIDWCLESTVAERTAARAERPRCNRPRMSLLLAHSSTLTPGVSK